mmetsp:Transcript_9939/g.31548  ORF Transcript_9939/g.31548 Transcript_9939/m.31548 type:complete len:209 (-) Transcript_9939:762-1388(-)
MGEHRQPPLCGALCERRAARPHPLLVGELPGLRGHGLHPGLRLEALPGRPPEREPLRHAQPRLPVLLLEQQLLRQGLHDACADHWELRRAPPELGPHAHCAQVLAVVLLPVDARALGLRGWLQEHPVHAQDEAGGGPEGGVPLPRLRQVPQGHWGGSQARGRDLRGARPGGPQGGLRAHRPHPRRQPQPRAHEVRGHAAVLQAPGHGV